MPTDLPASHRPPQDDQERILRAPGSLELDPAAEDIGTDETARLIASTRVEGTAVYDQEGTHLGAVKSVMLDKVSGQVAYVVLAAGGFLGLGESLHPLPWRSLRYSVELGGYVVEIDRDALEQAPGDGRDQPLLANDMPTSGGEPRL
ncbi:photosystem reaction center subunit H [Methylobacterium sp. Leaf399]|uniref:PRC-barrel domain-containing protein n=1 Tax=unclassified Methylobacterium TaxID=2615210 RepID=UPI0006F81DDC|nr:MULTISPECIES: PRC-barrel domain-containing protein [unclassified Methylobacterium]KQP55245.1 photosystem reaction center subunit H [Methylobacterium sp. Leaf108]KQT09986.1 photosystem reaction center subunit H [Methylobacterium sp. Leaf399]KQT87599.1 photosystem reaction center subunit H [Methylobacterium sp. Leaf466]